jgi:hypothetical protein
MLSINCGIYYTHEDLMIEIKNHKGNVNDIVYPEKYGTFLYKAVFHDYPTVVKYLLEHNADPNIIAEGIMRYDCLKLAINKNTYDIAEMLIKHGAKNINTDYFFYVVRHKQFKFAELILEQDKSMVQDTLYRVARFCYSDQLICLQFLVEHGAYINNDTRDIIYSDFVYDYYEDTSHYYDSEYEYESDSEYDSDSEIEEFHDYRKICINNCLRGSFEYISKKLAQRRWTFVKCYVLLLGLHQRAVVSANHPNRLKQLGVFNVKEE